MERIKAAFNGCFDLFHPGHKYIIHKGLDIVRPKDVLIAINTDNSVRQLKGEERPRIPLASRADAVQRCIDEWCQINLVHARVKIVPFDNEEQLLEILESFGPTVIIKGNDRPDVRKITGAHIFPTIIIPRLCDKKGNDISTSRILEKGYE